MVQESQTEARRKAYEDKVKEEVGRLRGDGIVLAGNAFAQVLFVKGVPNDGERRHPDALLAGADGKALRASLTRLGYPPEGWAAVSALSERGEMLEDGTFRLTVTTLDPDTLVLCDEVAADLTRNAYADELASVGELDQAMLAPGVVTRLRGMRVLNLGGFEDALSDDHQKQVMWARLKRIPPLGEPY